MSDPLLAVQDLRTWFESDGGPVRAVDGVSFDIRRGETFALLGESGCGKSMTALSLMQLVPGPAGRIMGGRVEFAGRDLLRHSEMAMRAVRGNRIAMIFQEPMTSLNPVLTIAEQIGEVLRTHRGLKGAAARARILELLRAVGIPAPEQRWRDYPHQLSGGMKQRVMIAAALAGDPDLLIADEPTTALDVTIQAQVLELLRDVQASTGMAILLITHDLGVVSEVADRVAVMYAGHIVEQAPVAEFFAAPQHPYSQKLFASLPRADRRGHALAVIEGTVPRLNSVFTGCRFVERCDHAWRTCYEVPPRWTNIDATTRHGVRCHLVDAKYRDTRPPTAISSAKARTGPGPEGKQEAVFAAGDMRRDGAPLLRVRNLKVYFPVRKGALRRTVGYVRAVDGVELTIPRRRTVALVGESGCGKTTVGKGILQLLRPTAGSVRFDGDELTHLRGASLRRRRRDFQVVFQDPFASLNPRMMVANIIEEGMVAQGVGGGEAARRDRIGSLLEQVGLARDAMYRYPHEFSGGQRQRICIARALAVEPKLIVCDEPTSALDVSVQAQILNLLRELQDQLGLSYLFITHNLSVVEYLSHEVAVMYLGRIVEIGTVAEVMSHPRHPYTEALLSAVPRIERGDGHEVIHLEGELPSPLEPPVGCHFHPRCPHAMAECRREYPGVSRLSDTHQVKCFLIGRGE